MPLIPPKSGIQHDPVPEGLHEAVCYSMVDLGVQEFEYLGKKKKAHQVLLTWELPNERIDVEKEGEPTKNLPRAISKKYTFSMHEKSNLYEDLTCWRGKSFTDAEASTFDLKNVLGKPCQLQVIHKESNGRTFANIKSIVTAPKGCKIQPENPLVYFCIADLDKPEIPASIPQWVEEMIVESETWKKLCHRSNQTDHPDTGEPPIDDPMPEDDGSDIPF